MGRDVQPPSPFRSESLRGFSQFPLSLTKGRAHGEFLSFSGQQWASLSLGPVTMSGPSKAAGASVSPGSRNHQDGPASGSHAARTLLRKQQPQPSPLPPPPNAVAAQELRVETEKTRWGDSLKGCTIMLRQLLQKQVVTCLLAGWMEAGRRVPVLFSQDHSPGLTISSRVRGSGLGLKGGHNSKGLCLILALPPVSCIALGQRTPPPFSASVFSSVQWV